MGIKPGDKVAFPKQQSSWGLSNAPKVLHTICEVERVTAAQIVLKGSAKRIWRKNAEVVGGPFAYAIEATPELIQQHEAEKEMLRRWNTASNQLRDLMYKPHHELKLNVAQLEHLAKAWIEAKAMGGK